MIDIPAFQKAFALLPKGAEEAEVNREDHRLCIIDASEGKVTGASSSEQTVYYIKVSGKRTGQVYTQNLTNSPEELIREAYLNSQYSEVPEPAEMRRGSEAVKKDFGFVPAESDISLLSDFAADFERELRSWNNIFSGLYISLRAETIGLHTVNSHGLDVRSTQPLYILYASFFSEKNGRMATGTYNKTAPGFTDFSVADFGKNASEILKSQFNPKPFRAGVYEAVLHRTVVYNILSTAWQLFSGHRYNEGSCFFSGKLGEETASSCLSIWDYTDCPGSGFNIPCDCEGTPGAPVKLMDNGVLTGLMHNLNSARKLGAEPTGNAGRRPLLSGVIPTDILVTPRNFCVQPGDSGPEELVGRVKNGVLVTSSSDVFHSINIASGSFSIPCRGLVIRNGKTEEATGPITLSGSLKGLFHGIEEAGSDLYLGTMLALDNYGIGAVSLRVKNLDFSGT